MTDFFGREIARAILNYTGGTLRWIYGSIWRNVFKKPKYTYAEYIHGPKNSSDYFDRFGHTFNNMIIALIFLGIIISILTR